jgi:hypothetical protein
MNLLIELCRSLRINYKGFWLIAGIVKKQDQREKMRKNIFEILSDFDLGKEVDDIWGLFRSKIVHNKWSHENEGIVELVNNYTFSFWKARSRCLSCENMFERLKLQDILISKEPPSIFLLIEYILNILRRCDMAIKACEMYSETSDYYLLKENCISFIEHFGYTNKYFDDDEIEIIVENNAAAISAAETAPLEISKKVIEYNHFILKGNILMKRDILTFIGNEIEPKREELKQINLNISNNLFFMLNNMNLRHNNTDKGGKHYNEFLAQMPKEQIEYWYDETYQLELLSLLLLANVERQKNIEELKKKNS